MSIRVEPEHLADHADSRPFAYLVTVDAQGENRRVHVVAVAVSVSGATVTCDRVGNSTRRNIEVDPSVTLVWPPAPSSTRESGAYDHYSLIADGSGSVHDDTMEVIVHAAILHRPA